LIGGSCLKESLVMSAAHLQMSWAALLTRLVLCERLQSHPNHPNNPSPVAAYGDQGNVAPSHNPTTG
jgi:hypothetical protein